jgi:hypothetical protein
MRQMALAGAGVMGSAAASYAIHFSLLGVAGPLE